MWTIRAEQKSGKKAPYLAKGLRLSHQNQQIGGQNGEAKIHQDYGPLRANVSREKEGKSSKHVR